MVADLQSSLSLNFLPLEIKGSSLNIKININEENLLDICTLCELDKDNPVGEGGRQEGGDKLGCVF